MEYNLTRRAFLKKAATAAGAIAVGPLFFKDKSGAVVAPPPLPDNAEYWRMIFDSKQHIMDMNTICVSLNGRELYVARNVEVILPDAYKQIFDHAAVSIFPGGSPKPTYPYKILGSATKRDYLRQLITEG